MFFYVRMQKHSPINIILDLFLSDQALMLSKEYKQNQGFWI